MTKAKKFRRIQTLISVMLFGITFGICWGFTGFNLKTMELSDWGIVSSIGGLWNFCLIVLSLSIYFNIHYYIVHHKRLIYRNLLYFLFFTVVLNLFLTGFYSMEYMFHYFSAFYYFFMYPLFIFILAHLNRKHLKYNEWFGHIFFSVLMIIVPIFLIEFFPGFAIPETVHSLFVVGWNVWLLRH